VPVFGADSSGCVCVVVRDVTVPFVVATAGFADSADEMPTAVMGLSTLDGPMSGLDGSTRGETG